ncbi:hypothetical protein LC609_37595 [Nostoc sp. XA013]|nr:hypothetical protein [Nostoc sp. XA013]
MLSFAVFAKIYLGSYFGKGIVVFKDLLMALGKTNVSILKESDLTLENLRLLDQVWTGENMRVLELIAMLEKNGEQSCS